MLTAPLALPAVIAWIVFGVGLYLGAESSSRLILAIAAAVATEAIFSSLAAELGISALEGRKTFGAGSPDAEILNRAGPPAHVCPHARRAHGTRII